MTNDVYVIGDKTRVLVYKGTQCVGIYDKETGIPKFVDIDRDIIKAPRTPAPEDLREKNKDDKEYKFRYVTEEMTDLYLRKNADYGDSFTESLDEDGLLVSKIRLKDKLNRFSQLISNDSLVNDESLEDTLIDLANYTVMTLMWARENGHKNQ